MASNVLKRIFGETKLELKLLLLFAAGLLLIIATAFWWYGRRTNRLVYEKNEDVGRALVDLFKTTVHADRPAFLATSSEEEGTRRAEENPWIKKMYQDFVTSKHKPKFIYYWKSPEDSGPEDEFETALCDEYRTAPPQKPDDPERRDFADRATKGNTEYEYFQPVYVQESCLGCHAPPPGGSGIAAAGLGVPFARRPVKPGPQGWQVGDLMAIAKVTIPNQSTQAKLTRNWAMLWAVAISTVFLGLLTSYAIIRYVIVKPLRHLRDVSDAVTRGNTALRAEIRTGDEFEQLATAFNRMLRTLVTSQDELRQANANLDGKVDELAQVNMRLYEMNQLKSEFLATMSHELRTPLNSILGFSEVLAGIESMDDRQKRYVQNIQTSGTTLLEMINDILDLAKIESGRMEIRLTDFRIHQIAAAQADMARPLAERKNIDLEVECDPDLPPLRQDQARVQQILGNLLSNAVKFTPEGGRVTVAAVREGDELVVRVIDTGVGIAEEDQQVIFEKFRQGKMSVPTGDIMAREYSGSGLGLSIVKELCKLLGGQVSVASELGKGSMFTVRLPWTLADPSRLVVQSIDDLEQFATAR
jgi:two-component system sensor histidine kinase BarA